MPKVFTNGCFDVLHAGHVQLLLHCRHLAGEDGSVIVAIDADTKIKRDKGRDRPYFDAETRRGLLEQLTSDGLDNYIVDQIEIFDTDEELYDLIQSFKPDIIVKGEDWQDKKVIGADLARVEYAWKFGRELDYSTSTIETTISNRRCPPWTFLL